MIINLYMISSKTLCSHLWRKHTGVTEITDTSHAVQLRIFTLATYTDQLAECEVKDLRLSMLNVSCSWACQRLGKDGNKELISCRLLWHQSSGNISLHNHYTISFSSFHLASAVCTVNSSQQIASSPASCRDCTRPLNFMNGHTLTIWFIVCWNHHMIHHI